MPSVPRANKKMQKIAFKIMGTPPAMREEKSRNKTEQDKRLTFEETSRSK